MAVVAGGCGASPRQDENEPEGNYRLEVSSASFPAQQSIAQSSTLSIRVRNADSKAAPSVAVTVETASAKPGESALSFGQRIEDNRRSDSSRPIWILDTGPTGGDTAATSTWALGRLKPGQAKTFNWRLTAVEPGTYTINYRISPGLDGRARLTGGGRTKGSFKVRIAGDPVPARVDDNGNVVRGEEAGGSGGSSGESE
ncbi:MAG TPA: hypothetical protein VES79_08360 [Solirubrobacteraceae bacterium]|nr:hypothetical protein [Solirubrobacteraceae bacterium]